MKRTNVRRLTIIGVLTAISFILLQTGLGIIQIPGLPLKITIMHLPVIIAAIMEGPIAGGITGLFFGVFSILDKLMRPGPIQQINEMFYNPLVSVVPRILIGIVSYYVYRAIKTKVLGVRTGIAAVAGSLTNTIGVLGMIWLLYGPQYAAAMGKAGQNAFIVIFGAAATNGIMEAVCAAAITIPVIYGLSKVYKKSNR